MKNYFAPADIVRYTAPYAVNPGDGMLVGGLFGVACTTAASGEKTDVSTEGMYYLTSVSAETAAEGAVAYWDAGNRRVSVTTGTAIGHFPYGKGAGETSTRVRLQAGSGGAVSKYGNSSRAYTGQFSSGARIPTVIIAAGTATQMAPRARYWARSTVYGPQFAWANAVAVSNNGGLETGTGGAATITAGLEYNGVTYPITWDGATSVVVPDLAVSPLCDPIPVWIAKGDPYFIRTYYTNASGIICETGNTGAESGDSPNGEGFRYATTGLADQTTGTGLMTGGTAGDQNRYGPLLHVASITIPSVLIVGTSLELGYRETCRGGLGFGDKGISSRFVGPYFGYCNVAQGGASAGNFLSAGRSTLRLALQKYFTHVITDHGVNDILNDNVSETVIAARLQRLAELFPGKGMICTTTLPRTTGAWTLADGSDQTVFSTNGWATRRPNLNAMKRAGISGYLACIDVSSAAELPTDSAKWFANGTTNYMFGPYTSPDGLHEGTVGGERIRASGVFDQSIVQR